jgi:hypothetical protein
MARIRTIKPEFFRHEGLQDLGAESMLVFAGLWTQCDSRGRFRWRPRQLKLDILPFMDFDMEVILEKLRESGFLEKYEVDGKYYGLVPTFRDHQRLTGKEREDGEKYPEPLGKHRGSIGETSGKQEGGTGERPVSQEREREKEKEREKERNTYGDDFLEFWKSYPKKVGKDEAWRAWKKRNGSKPSIEIIVNAVEMQKKSNQWIRDGGQYIPNPATWINQGRWADEPTEQHPLKGKVSDKTLSTVTALQDWRPPK